MGVPPTLACMLVIPICDDSNTSASKFCWATKALEAGEIVSDCARVTVSIWIEKPALFKGLTPMYPPNDVESEGAVVGNAAEEGHPPELSLKETEMR